MQTKHFRFFRVRQRSERSDDWRKLLLVGGSFGSASWYLSRSRLYTSVHWLFQRKSEIIFDHLWRPWSVIGKLFEISRCGSSRMKYFWAKFSSFYICLWSQKYRCWVYQRADLNRVLISQAVGAFCHIKQDVTSWNYTEGAVVALDMTEYERERK